MTALTEVAALLACPECGDTLQPGAGTLRCGNRHSFDIARQGYVGLLTGASTKMTGDTAAMLDARAAFQSAGHFAPIANAVAQAFHSAHPAGHTPSAADAGLPYRHASSNDPGSSADAGSLGGAVLEIGAGTGYYLGEVLDAHPGLRGIALDVAKPAARRAARAHPRLASILADAWRGLPIRDDALTGVLSVFAPRNPSEVARALAAGGRFVVVTPTPRHLGELIEPLGMVRVDPDKEHRLDDALSGTFTRIDHVVVEFPMKLSRADVTNVVAMGPSAFHTTAGDDPRIAGLADITGVTASVTVARYAPVG
ncbi:putative RNA methyltransferase [Nocardia ignorata]|uniref:putative RNA methyltransferase n=1 Tax=Nocardia ignorata TaxID=145285 RepID=UPI003633FD6A